MNGNNFENMIKKYADELIKMSKEKMLPDESEEPVTDDAENQTDEEGGFNPFDIETDKEEKEVEEKERLSVADIPGIKETDFYEETAEEVFPEEKEEGAADTATFSARVFTGNNAYPIENAKVLVIRDDKLYTYLTTDRNGVTKVVSLPASPEMNSFNPESDNRSLQYTGEVYATGFTPKKNLLISAVGGSDIILDVQMSPISEREV